MCHTLSNLEKKLNNIGQAKNILESVINFKPTSELCIALNDIYTELGQYDKAKNVLNLALNICKNDHVKILLSLAILEEAHFNNDKLAERLIDRALKIDSKDIHIYIAKASILMRQNDVNNTRITFEIASKLFANDGKHFNMWSSFELRQGQ